MEEITSRANARIKEAAALKDAAARKKTGLFLLEGARLCADAAAGQNDIELFFATPQAEEKYKKEFSLLLSCAKKSFYINDSVADKLSDTKNSQQFFCVCREKKQYPAINKDGMYVFTDNIQNPDNLGAAVRTAEALGADGIIVNSGCDIYSPKAQRAAMGALLRFPVIKTENSSEILMKCKNMGMRILASSASAEQSVCDVKKDGGVILVIGNEGSGVSEEVMELSDVRIKIPMKGKAESLNAAAAAAILIWEFMKDR